ncbi:MAG: PKD domain-containing protein, partial [Chitinophagaceae bacterium]|nr:PKD domain-containing protein [Chitinophagaceae bacterium]
MDTNVTFRGDLNNGSFFLRKTGFTVVQHHAGDMERIAEDMHGHSHSSEAEGKKRPVRPTRDGRGNTSKDPNNGGSSNNSGDNSSLILRSHAYTMDFVGANPHAQRIGEKPQQGYNNYFIGDDSSKWASNCQLFQVITYKNVYPGIDVKYYSESGMLKYEFIIQPGADPSKIAMKFNGVERLSIRNNELIIGTSVGDVKELAPYTYQSDIQGRRKIDCRYKIENNNIVRFALKDYDRASTLIIDPTLIFASLSGSTADNWGYTATYGIDGSFYSGGIVFGSGYPISPGAYQTSYSGSGAPGSYNMGIMKLSADGSRRIYATYIGGDGNEQPHSLICDERGNLVIAGRTNSTNYPAFFKNVIPDMGGRSGTDIVVTKLNATGTALIGSARVGGPGNDGLNTRDSHKDGPFQLISNYGDDARSEVILDAAGNIYLASCSQSGDFPTTLNAPQKTLSGLQDAVLIKLNPNCSALLLCTLLGGTGYEAGFVLALNPANQDIYIAGATTSPNDLPGSKIGSKQSVSMGGLTDGFIAVYSNDGSILRQSTYLGTAGTDFIFGIQFDRNAFPYVMGTTTGQWEVVNAKYSNKDSKQFISKLNKDLSGFQYSTVFGSGSTSPNISPVAFLVDRCENVYVSGWGKDIIGEFTSLAGTQGMPITPDAIQSTTDNNDFYFIVIKRDAEELLYGTYYGERGGTGEHVDGGTSRFDANGVIYQAICANCGPPRGKPRWPVTSGAWCCATGWAPASGGGCNLGALKISFNYSGVGVSVKSFLAGNLDSTVCAPATIEFRDTVRNAARYEWNFGDGSPEIVTTEFRQSHFYANVGNYRVRLIAIDSTTCNIRDTSYVTISVRDNKAELDWTYEKTVPCPDLSLQYTFRNLSTAPASVPFKNNSFIWDMGDGTRIDPAGTSDITHTFRDVGSYNVRLILTDTNYCNAPDSTTLKPAVRVSPVVVANFETPLRGCAPYDAVFNNTSLGGQTFEWNFGDGSPLSTDINPTHVYAAAGTYTITLRAFDPLTCNLTDDTSYAITLFAAPVASFSFTPVPPIENTANVFTNSSSPDANRFLWDFGDGDTLITSSRAQVEHQYNETWTFTACLKAFNAAGCEDDT